MGRKRWLLTAIGVVLGAGLALVAFRRPPPPPHLPGSFAFAALGDAPYSRGEEIRYEQLMADLDRSDLRWVLQVGDILAGPCTDARFKRSFDWFDQRRHPVVYTPGDNEWTDCGYSGSGSFDPLERLARLRQMFFPRPGRTLGRAPMEVASQGSSADFPEFVENVRWTHAGLVFATVHIVGSDNGTLAYAPRTRAAYQAWRRRTEAAAAWLREAFGEAEARRAEAVVLAFQAFPLFDQPPDHPSRRPYDPFMLALEEEAERFGRPVLAIHGDQHTFIVDRPLVRRTTGRRLDNVTRLEVPGSPKVGWVRVTVLPGRPVSFHFQPHIVSRWRLW